jgi:hypothetical protein
MAIFIYFLGLGLVICWALGIFGNSPDPDLTRTEDK